MLRSLKPEPLEVRAKKLYDAVLGRDSDDKDKFSFDFDVFVDSFILLYEEYCTQGTSRNACVESFANKHKERVNFLKSLRPTLKDFEIVKCIGKGHFGKVHIVNDKYTGRCYAMKTLDKDKTIKEGHRACYMEERDVMGLTSSKWIVNLHYSFQDEKNLYFLMDYIPYGNLGDLLDYLENNIMDEDTARFYLAEMAAGINSLHEIGYIHRDIKPENVLINSDGHIKLADFGTAIKICDAHKKSCGIVGTPEYMAPEIFNPSKPTTIGVDYWSLGVTAYVLFYADFPFFGDTQIEMIANITNFETSFKFLEEFTVSDTAKDLITSLIAKEDQRLTFEKLKLHPYFDGIDWDNMENIPPPTLPEEVKEPQAVSEDDARSRANLYVSRRSLNHDIGFIGFSYSRPFFELIKNSLSRFSLQISNNQISNNSTICDDTLKLHLAEIGKLNTSISELTIKNEEIKSICQEKSQKLSKAEESLSSLKSELNESKAKITELTVQSEHHFQDHMSIKSTLSKYEDCFKSLGFESLEKFVPQYMQMSENLKIITREKEMYQEKSKKLMNEIADLNKNVGEYKENINDSQNELKAANRNLKMSLESAENKLINSISEYSTKISSQEAKLQAANSKISQLEAELADERSKKDLLQSKIPDSTKIDDLECNLDTAKKNIMDLTSEKSKLQATLSTNEQYVKKLQDQVSEGQKKCQEYESTMSSHQYTIKVLNESINMLRFSINNIKKDLSTQFMQCENYRQMHEKTEAQLVQSKKSYNELLDEYETFRSSKRWDENDVEQIKKIFNSQIDSLKEELQQSNNQISELSKSLMEEKTQRSILMNNLKDLKEVFESKSALLLEMEEKLKEKTETCIQLKSEIVLQKEIHDFALNSKVSDFQRKNEELYKTAQVMKMYMMQDEKLRPFVQNLNLETSIISYSSSTPIKQPSSKECSPAVKKQSNPLSNAMSQVMLRVPSVKESNVNENVPPPQQLSSSKSMANLIKSPNTADHLRSKFTVRKTKESIRKSVDLAGNKHANQEILSPLASPDIKKEENISPDLRDSFHVFSQEVNVRPGSCPTCFNPLPWGQLIFRCSQCKVSCHLNCSDLVPYNCFKVKKPLFTNQLSPLSPIYLRTPSLASYINFIVDLEEDISGNIMWKRCWLTWNEGLLAVYENEEASHSKDDNPAIPIFKCFLDSNFTIHPSFNASLLPINVTENNTLTFCIEYSEESQAPISTAESLERKLSQTSLRSSFLTQTEFEPFKRIFFKAEDYESKRDWVRTFMKYEHSFSSERKLLPRLTKSFILPIAEALDIVSTCLITPEILLLGCYEGLYLCEPLNIESKLTPLFTEISVRQILLVESFLFLLLDESKKILYYDLKSALVDRKLIFKRITKSPMKDKFITLTMDEKLFMMTSAPTKSGHMVATCSKDTIYILSPDDSEFKLRKTIKVNHLITSMYFDDKTQKLLFITDKLYEAIIDDSTFIEFSSFITNNMSNHPSSLLSLHSSFIGRIQTAHHLSSVIYVCLKDCIFFVDDCGNHIEGLDPIELPATPLQIFSRACYLVVSFPSFIQIYSFKSAICGQTIQCFKYDQLSHRIVGYASDPNSVFVTICHSSSLVLNCLDACKATIITNLDTSSHKEHSLGGKGHPLSLSKESKRSSLRSILKIMMKNKNS